MKEYSDFADYYFRHYGKAEFKTRDLHFYSTYLLANFCMPTLLKIKPSSMISMNKAYIPNIGQLLYCIENDISYFSCSYAVLHENDHMLLLLIYDQNQLSKVINQPELDRYLTAIGYRFREDPVSSAINIWKYRYQEYETCRCIERTSNEAGIMEYPHEIGLFLGFPLDDVMDFIRYQGKNYLYCGYWKVYHNVGVALTIFQDYRAARDTALDFLLSGKKLKDISFPSLRKQIYLL